MAFTSKLARARKELLLGGRADGVPDSAFDPRQLRKGVREEREHTPNKRLAREIARDHLAEHPDYYTRLERAMSKRAEELSPEERKSVQIMREQHVNLRPTLNLIEGKVGDRVFYAGETGWKYGEDAAHTRSCSVDLKHEEAKRAYEKKVGQELKDSGMDHTELWRAVRERVEKKYPEHHGGEWKNEAVRNGDLGTITKVDRPSKSRGPEYHIRWDRHPNCAWGAYRRGSELRHAGKGFIAHLDVVKEDVQKLPALIERMRAIFDSAKKPFVVKHVEPSKHWRGIRERFAFVSTHPEPVQYVHDARYGTDTVPKWDIDAI